MNKTLRTMRDDILRKLAESVDLMIAASEEHPDTQHAQLEQFNIRLKATYVGTRVEVKVHPVMNFPLPPGLEDIP